MMGKMPPERMAMLGEAGAGLVRRRDFFLPRFLPRFFVTRAFCLAGRRFLRAADFFLREASFFLARLFLLAINPPCHWMLWGGGNFLRTSEFLSSHSCSADTSDRNLTS